MREESKRERQEKNERLKKELLELLGKAGSPDFDLHRVQSILHECPNLIGGMDKSDRTQLLGRMLLQDLLDKVESNNFSLGLVVGILKKFPALKKENFEDPYGWLGIPLEIVWDSCCDEEAKAGVERLLGSSTEETKALRQQQLPRMLRKEDLIDDLSIETILEVAAKFPGFGRVLQSDVGNGSFRDGYEDEDYMESLNPLLLAFRHQDGLESNDEKLAIFKHFLEICPRAVMGPGFSDGCLREESFLLKVLLGDVPVDGELMVSIFQDFVTRQNPTDKKFTLDLGHKSYLDYRTEDGIYLECDQATALSVLLPRLEEVDFGLSLEFSEDGLEHFLPALGANQTITKLGLPLWPELAGPATAKAFERALADNDTLRHITVLPGDANDDGPFEAFAAGMARNATIESVLLDEVELSDEATQYMSSFLSNCGAKVLVLDNFISWGGWRSCDFQQRCNITKLRVLGDFEQSYYREMLDQVFEMPHLRELDLEHVGDHPVVVELARRGLEVPCVGKSLQKLELDGIALDVEALEWVLRNNDVLTHLRLGSVSLDIVEEIIRCMAKHMDSELFHSIVGCEAAGIDSVAKANYVMKFVAINTTTSACSDRLFVRHYKEEHGGNEWVMSETGKALMDAVLYSAALNQHGRGQIVRQTQWSPSDCDLLAASGDADSEFNIQFGLLRAVPSVWSG